MPQGGDPDLDPQLLAAALLQFNQRQIRLLGDPSSQRWLMQPQPRTPVSTNLLGPAVAVQPVLLPKSLHALATDAKALANLSGARAVGPRRDDPLTQVFTQWSHVGFS